MTRLIDHITDYLWNQVLTHLVNHKIMTNEQVSRYCPFIIDMVKKYPEFPWVPVAVAQNLHAKPCDLLALSSQNHSLFHPDLSLDIRYLISSRRDISFRLVISDIIKRGHDAKYDWNWFELSRNPSVVDSSHIVMTFISLPWDWHGLA